MAKQKKTPKARILPGTLPGEDILNGSSISPLAIPDLTTADKTIPLKGNSLIWGTEKDGPGPIGDTSTFEHNKSAIHLVAGLGGRNVDSSTAIRLNNGSATLPGKVGDSATVTVTESTSDEFRGIPEGEQGMSENKSAVILKGDDIRSVSRRGTKIITGPGGPEGIDSTLEQMNEVFGVDIIAAGRDHTEKGEKYLQPMVKGLKLQKAMRQMNKNIKQLNANVMMLHNVVHQMTSILATSTYYGANAGGPVTCVSPTTMEAARFLNGLITQLITPDLRALAEEINHFETNFIEKSGNESFLSKLNNVN